VHISEVTLSSSDLEVGQVKLKLVKSTENRKYRLSRKVLLPSQAKLPATAETQA
jgi:hypothetical protein